MPWTKGKRRAYPLKPHEGRYRIWAAIRSYPRFTAREIAAISEAHIENVKTYLQALVKAGFLRITPHPGGTPADYELIRDPGPIAPRVNRRRAVLDLNAELSRRTSAASPEAQRERRRGKF